PEHMAARLAAEAMRLVDQSLQYRERIGGYVLRFACGRKGVSPAGEKLDPIHATFGVLANRRLRFLDGPHGDAGQRVCGIRGRCCGGPDNSAARDLEPRTVEAPLVDGIANIDVGISVPMRTHVPRSRE